MKQVALLILAILPLYSSFAHANNAQRQAENELKTLYHSLNTLPREAVMAERINYISHWFLNRPYQLWALGEGEKGVFDQYPLYRSDAFDCGTFVDTVVALALAQNVKGFQSCIRRIRYRHGVINFLHRNHFISLDWNPNNQQMGFIKDITASLKDKKGRSVALTAQGIMNKSNWYRQLPITRIRLSRNKEAKEKQRLQQILQQQGAQFKATRVSLPYVPLNKFFNEEGHANMYLFDQIPNGAIVEIVRPNWDLTASIGTHLHVSHLGFVIRKKKQVIFREASSKEGYIVDTNLIDYLRLAQKSPTIKGINIQVILPKQPLSESCETTDHSNEVIRPHSNSAVIR